GPQTLVIEAGSIDEAGDPQVTTHLVVTLKDVLPPSLHVMLASAQTMTQLPGRPPYVIAPAEIDITVTTTDETDPSPSIAAYHNGEPFTLGSAIDEVGLHILRIEAADESGNVRGKTVIFQIRDQPLYEPALVVESFACTWSGDTVASVDATVLIASSAFDVWGIHLGSTQLLLLDTDGHIITRGATINGVTASASGAGEPVVEYIYDGEQIEAQYQHGYWRLSYSIDLSDAGLTSSPASLIVAGRSASTRSAAPFEFIGNADALTAGDAIGELEMMGLIDITIPSRPTPGAQAPGGDPPIACAWRYELESWVPDACSHVDGVAQSCGWFDIYIQHAETELYDSVGSPEGNGWATDDGCPGAAASSCSVAASGTLHMWLEPAPPDTACSITVRAWPRFRAHVYVNTPATATAGGQITVSGGGLQVTASGAVSVGSSPPANIIIGPGWEIPVVIGSADSETRTFAPLAAQENTTPVCAVTIEIGSAGYIDVAADGWGFPLGDLYGHASAQLNNASPNVTLIGSVTAGPCTGMTRNETYE
ncbi:MAG: hypothetical protein JRF63_12450, partial [Deltaproteobacteria bacterium]|nr:hypothetical protein [Deltaproteobacteria bacterium]